MKQFPNNIIYKKSFKQKLFKGHKGNTLAYFTTGLRITQNTYLSFIHIETMRRVMRRLLRTKGVKNTRHLKYLHSAKKRFKRKRKSKKKVWQFRTNFWAPLTKKPLQVRMGKGKGNPYKWVYPIKQSRVIIEMSRQHTSLIGIHRLLKYSSMTIPKKTRFIFDRKYLRREHNYKTKK